MAVNADGNRLVDLPYLFKRKKYEKQDPRASPSTGLESHQ